MKMKVILHKKSGKLLSEPGWKGSSHLRAALVPAIKVVPPSGEPAEILTGPTVGPKEVQNETK